MNKTMKKLACVLLLGAALPAVAADCVYPRTPARLPDGNTATREEMLAGKKAVDAYIAEMNTYLDCIKAEHDTTLAAQASATDEQKKAITVRFVQKNDAAVDEQQDVAARFNEQLRVFKARTSK